MSQSVLIHPQLSHITDSSTTTYIDTPSLSVRPSLNPDGFIDMKETKIEYGREAPVRRAYSIREVAAALGICERSVRRLIDRGLLRPCRVLRHLMIPAEQLDELLKK